MLDDVLVLIRKLDVKGDNIKIAAANLKILSQVRGRLEKILLNPQYVQSVKDYVKTFDTVMNLQHDYFSEIEKNFKPPKFGKEIKKQAIQSVVNQLTENGLSANVVDKVGNLIRLATTSGASYSTLNQQLTDFLTNNHSGDGQLLKYTRQITTDAINQFNGQYTQIISSDLGYEWFRYSGSNLETSRPFCLACTYRKYFHISELPEVLKGQFEEFKKFEGKVNKKTGLPDGMIPGTDVSNFMVNRGGYNCGHQWRPVSEDLVPMNIRNRVYASQYYKEWAKVNGKQLPQDPLIEQKEVAVRQPTEPDPDVKPKRDTGMLNLDITGLVALYQNFNKLSQRIRKERLDKIKQVKGMEEKYSNIVYGEKKGVYVPDDRRVSSAEMEAAMNAADAGYDIVFTSPGEFPKQPNKRFPANHDNYIIANIKKYPTDIKTNYEGSSNSFKQSIISAREQAETIMINVVTRINLKDIADGINSGFYDNQNAKRLLLIYKGRTLLLKRTIIENKTELIKVLQLRFDPGK